MPFLLNDTATDHVDLMDKLIDFATNDTVETVAIAAGGAGYTVGDILTASGGTFTLAAQFEVTSVAAGVVDGIKVARSGVGYTATPGNPVSTTGGTGAGCTLTLTFGTPWTLRRRTRTAASAVVGTAGTGYAVNDKLFVADVIDGTQAQFNVDTIGGGGAVLTVSLDIGGHIHEPQANDATTTTDGSGTGCELTVTYNFASDTTLEHQLILEGADSSQPFIGIRAYKAGLAHNFELAGFTGYTSTQTYESQPGISPGRYDASSVGSPAPDEGAYTPLDNNTINYWLFLNDRKITGVFKMGASTYTNMYLGFFNPFGTNTEFPYPMAVFGCRALPNTLFSSTVIGYSGMIDPIGFDQTDQNGPALLRDVAGVWKSIRNSRESSGSRISQEEFVCWPAGTALSGTDQIADDDKTSKEGFTSTGAIPHAGNPGSPLLQFLRQTPDTNNLATLVPTMLIEAGSLAGQVERMIHGELSGLHWMSNAMDLDVATAASEDVIEEGSGASVQRYHVFQNVARTSEFTFFAIKEE